MHDAGDRQHSSPKLPQGGGAVSQEEGRNYRPARRSSALSVAGPGVRQQGHRAMFPASGMSSTKGAMQTLS